MKFPRTAHARGGLREGGPRTHPAIHTLGTWAPWERGREPATSKQSTLPLPNRFQTPPKDGREENTTRPDTKAGSGGINSPVCVISRTFLCVWEVDCVSWNINHTCPVLGVHLALLPNAHPLVTGLMGLGLPPIPAPQPAPHSP